MPVPDFSVGEVFTASAADSIGMWKITEVTASAQTAINVQSCFTNAYQNYRVIFRLTGSATTFASFQFFTGTNTPVTADYYRRGYSAAGTLTLSTAGPATDLYLGDVSTTATSLTFGTIDILGPNNASRPTVIMTSYDHFTPVALSWAGSVVNNTAKTGFRIITSSGNTLTGTVRVYGYRD